MEEGTLELPRPPGTAYADCNQWDVSERCEGRRMLERIADKWSLMTMDLLGRRTMRFSELRRSIPQISQRMMTATLRQLERDGMVARKVYPVVPPKVEYWLTPLGEALLAKVNVLADWVDGEGEQIADARARFDAQEKD